MNQKQRIEKDLELFEKTMKKAINKRNIKIISLSNNYYNDSKHYLKKKDYFTAFGCINYAHGLLDAYLSSNI